MAEDTKKELISIKPENFFSDWDGTRVKRDVRVTGTDYKLEFNLPVPATAEEVAEMYKIDNATEVLAIAVKQISYNRDTDLRKNITEADIDWSTADGEAQAELFQNCLTNPPEKKVSEAKKVKSVMAKHGLAGISAEELDAILAQVKKQQAKAKK